MNPLDRIQDKVCGLQSTVEKLAESALARVQEGFAPPTEIYRAEVRNRIDWSRFPLWARWTDPEVYTGSCHEG